jgi:hypothetical protein
LVIDITLCDGIGKVKKVGFFVIAKNLLENKNLPKP